MAGAPNIIISLFIHDVLIIFIPNQTNGAIEATHTG